MSNILDTLDVFQDTSRGLVSQDTFKFSLFKRNMEQVVLLLSIWISKPLKCMGGDWRQQHPVNQPWEKSHQDPACKI